MGIFSMGAGSISEHLMTRKEEAVSRLSTLLVSVTGRRPDPELVTVAVEGLIEAVFFSIVEEAPAVAVQLEEPLQLERGTGSIKVGNKKSNGKGGKDGING